MRRQTILIGILVVCALGFGLLALSACGPTVNTDTAEQELELTEQNQSRMIAAVPPPKFNTSQERKNLVRRLETFNVEDKISYIYLLTDYGQLVRFDTIIGKVSSVNSMLTCTDQPYEKSGSQGRAMVTLPSPDFDGSYGSNGDAIFWFNQDGAYCEWNGKYFLTDQPLKLTVTPLIVEKAEND